MMPDSKFATKNDVYKIVSEATDAIISGIDNLLQNYPKKENLHLVDKKIDRIESKVNIVERQISDIKTHLSDTVSTREFNTFKEKINFHHLIN